MTVKNQSNHIIIEQASHWAMLVDERELDAEQKYELSQWLLESPVHIEEFLHSCAIFDLLTDVDSSKKISIDALIEEISNNKSHVVPFNDETSNVTSPYPRKKIRKKAWLALTASIIFSFTYILNSPLQNSPTVKTHYITERGEQQSAALTDGSIIYLNTQTNLHIDFTEHYRNIRLHSGEAIFKVAHNPKKPFRVWVKGVMFQALGTEFNIKANQDNIELTVITGEVALVNQSFNDTNMLLPQNTIKLASNMTLDTSDAKTLIVSIGQEAVVENNGVITASIDAIVAKKTSWKARQLIFKHEKLQDVVYEFNRYNTIQIEINSKALSHLPITGVFETNNPLSLLEFLEGSGKARIHKVGTKKVIVYAL